MLLFSLKTCTTIHFNRLDQIFSIDCTEQGSFCCVPILFTVTRTVAPLGRETHAIAFDSNCLQIQIFDEKDQSVFNVSISLCLLLPCHSMENKSDFERPLSSPSCLHALQTNGCQTIWPELKVFLYMTEKTGVFYLVCLGFFVWDWNKEV